MKRRAALAHILPLGVFLGFLGLTQALATFGAGYGDGLLREPKYWVYPLQTAVCGVLLVVFWRHYDLKPSGWVAGVLAGLVALAVWVSPQWLFGRPARVEGFNPDLFAESPGLYWFVVLWRLARLVVVVPLVEEIFWRGFLMRYLINENFTSVRFGSYSPLSFFGVAGAFMLVHSPEDWPAAFVTGLLFGWVAVQTKSLFACVLAHAVANVGLGMFIMSTKQWGFW